MPGDSMNMAHSPDDLVELGRIVSAYGVKGWVKIQPYSAHAEVLLNTKFWWLKTPMPSAGVGVLPSARLVKVIQARPQGAALVACLDNASDRDQADALKGHTVWVSRGSFPPPEHDEYYWVDLIGCQLFGTRQTERALIGVVQEVIDNGAHAILRVARADPDEHGGCTLRSDAKGRFVDVLVPFVSAHVHTVDLANKRLESYWPVDI